MFRSFPPLKVLVIITIFYLKAAFPLPFFVVLVCSYNNAKFYQKNLTSIFEQTYPHFRVLYIDDHSSDGTALKVKQFYKLYRPRCQFSLIENPVNLGCMHNTYRAIHSCQDREIIVIVDGDDWLAHKNVLLCLSKHYEREGTWLTYGQYREYPSQKIGISSACNKEALKKGRLREMEWTTSHLKSFYAGLFKKIKKEDLMRNGKFIWVTSDQAFMLPMLDMARERAHFIEDVLYIYNKGNSLGDHQTKAKAQLEMKRYIRSLPSYPAVSKVY